MMPGGATVHSSSEGCVFKTSGSTFLSVSTIDAIDIISIVISVHARKC